MLVKELQRCGDEQTTRSHAGGHPTVKGYNRAMRLGHPVGLGMLLVAVAAARAAEPAPLPSPPPAAAATPPASALVPPAFRLPAGVRPTHYTLELTVDPAQAPYHGVVTIDLAVAQATPAIWLHALGLGIDGAELAVAGARRAVRVLSGSGPFVGFAPDRPLAAGAAQLIVRFHGTMDSEKSRGLYRVAEHPGEWYAYTFFEPIDARRAFPCFDEPQYKVPWRLRLHVPRRQVALGNAPVESERDEAGGGKLVMLADSKPMPSYLVAFVVGPFDLVDGGSAGRARTPIRFVVPRGRGGETGYARAITGRIVTLLEDFFDQPYPFGKLDVAVVPRYWGTMEHPGLVALGQPLTLIKPDETGLMRKIDYANIAIHELAHYWFGDVVTCAWWDDVWLNESLGTWLDGKITDQLEPAWKFALGRDPAAVASALAADALPTAVQIRLPVDTAEQLESSFDDEITYFKGAAVLRMVEHWVGPARLQEALRAYVRAHAWGNADEHAFLAALERALGAAPAQVMASFVDQPGFPLVSARVQCAAGQATLQLAQKRFFAAEDAPSPARWTVPICYRLGGDGGGDARGCTLLTSATAMVPLRGGCPRWIMANEDGRGYYRVRYDGDALRALLPVWTRLSVRERLQLADDVEAEASQGALPGGDALALLPTLLGDPDLRVLARGLRLLGLLHPRELGDDERAAFGRALSRLLGPRVRGLGWAPSPGEDPALTELRPHLWRELAEWTRDGAIIAEAQRLAGRWLVDRNALAPDLVPTVLGIAALSGDARLFDAWWAEARRTTDRRERTLLLGALGGFRDPQLNRRALALVLGQGADVRDTLGIVARAGQARETRAATWSFLAQHWDELVARLRDDEAAGLYGQAPTLFCDEAHRREAAALLTPRVGRTPGAQRQLDAALDSVHACARGLERNRAAIRAFLRQF